MMIFGNYTMCSIDLRRTCKYEMGMMGNAGTSEYCPGISMSTYTLMWGDLGLQWSGAIYALPRPCHVFHARHVAG